MSVDIKNVAKWLAKYSKAYTDNVAKGKQDTISDLATIRDGASKGATALQKHQDISGKQDVITDLATIRSNASTGAGLSAQVAQNKADIKSLSDGKVNKTANILWIDSNGYLNVGGIQ